MSSAITDPGQYLNAISKHDDVREVVHLGTTILFYRPARGEPESLQLAPEFTLHPWPMGESAGVSLRVNSPEGSLIYSRPELKLTLPARSPDAIDEAARLSQKHYGGVLNMVSGRSGVFAARFGGRHFALLQGLAGELPECQLIKSYRLNESDPDQMRPAGGYFCSRTNGFLLALPGCTARSVANFRACGTVGSHVVLKGPEGVADFFLEPDESRQVNLGRPPAEPFALRIYGEPGSLANVWFDSDAREPFLYGADPAALAVIAAQARWSALAFPPSRVPAVGP